MGPLSELIKPTVHFIFRESLSVTPSLTLGFLITQAGVMALLLPRIQAQPFSGYF